MGQAFANIISQSEPRFTVGIFGGWGSGKTTLMNAIMAALPQDSVVSVEFNAWRFEREPSLLVPLLDTIRAALAQWSDAHPDPQAADGQEHKIRNIARRVGRVVRALATGLSVDVGMPGAVTAHYDVSTASDALSALTQPLDPNEPPDPQSLYVTAYAELDSAFSGLSDGGVSRVVVFVDDLDRCLPENALNVLESMKLFFDLYGFVFVVGLDEDLVERAIRAKFPDQDESAATSGNGQSPVTTATKRLGREYIKKIFQVPYSLPAMLPGQLGDLLESMYGGADLGSTQLDDMNKRVRPYLGYLASERRVNPREVKRFINAYLLQTLIRSDLDADTVLALQTLAFRTEWEPFYDQILLDSELFVSALRNYRDGDEDAFKSLDEALPPLLPSLGAYLREPLGEPLARHNSLDDYISSLQSTSSSGSWTLEAFKQLENLRKAIQDAVKPDSTNERARSAGEMASTAAGAITQLLSGAAVSSETSAGLVTALQGMQATASSLLVSLAGHPGSLADVDRAQLKLLGEQLQNARKELRWLRETSVR
jgi:hypothetical protein